MSLAIIIIASEKRRESTFPVVLESAREQEPDELVVVADFKVEAKGVRSYLVPTMLGNTIDALVKRDVGALVTHEPNLCYLCDDHRLAPGFVETFRGTYNRPSWSILVPSRYTVRDGLPKLWLNVGQDYQYAGGHCAIYRRYWIQELPWAAGPHHLNWDLYFTHALTRMGAQLEYAGHDLAVEDIEPGAEPWR